MKTNWKLVCSCAAAAVLIICTPAAFGQSFPNWNGTTASWSNNANWTGGNASSYGQLEFKGNGVAVTDMDFGSSLSQWRLYFDGTKAYTLGSSTGQAVDLFDFGGAHAWILSDAEAAQTFTTLNVNFAATAGANFGQVSARSSHNLVLNNLGITGSAVTQARFATEGTGDIIVNGAISGASKQVVIGLNESSADIGSTDVTFNGANTYTGDTFIVAGALHLGSGSSLASGSAFQLGQTSGSAAATLDLASTTGGQSFSNALTIRSGSSGLKTIQSSATSGTNTLSGNVMLNADLTTSSASGGTLLFNTTGSFNVTDKKLTVTGAGTTEISAPLTSSLGTGGYLVKEGTGTLYLSGTSNTYTGTGSGILNANGTQINAGTLAIAADTSLGLVPSAPYNNIQFTGSSTLQARGAVFLDANRNISISPGVTATFDSSDGLGGNFAFGVQGVVSGSGNVHILGNGAVEFTSANTYTGTTTATGQLTVSANNALGSIGSGTVVNAGGSLNLNSGVAYTSAEPLTLNGTGLFNGGALAVSGASGAHSFAGPITLGSDALIKSYGGGFSSPLTLTGGISTSGTTLTFDLDNVFGQGVIRINTNGITGAAANSNVQVVEGLHLVVNAPSTYNGTTSVTDGATLVATNTTGSAIGTGDITVDATSYLAGNQSGTGVISPGTDNSIYINGTLLVGDPTAATTPSRLALSTSGAGSVTMGAGSAIHADLFSGAGAGDNTGNAAAADYIRLSGTMNILSTTTLVLHDQTLAGTFADGDMWKIFDLSGGGVISGAALTLDYSALNLGSGLAGLFNSSTGVFSIVAVPEPGRALLLTLAITGLALRRRRTGLLSGQPAS